MDAVAGAMREGAANPAREALAAGAPTRYSIARYPTTLIDRLSLADGRVVTIRPVLPQDAELAQRFVADDPPGSLVERMAATFRKSGGDIRAVLAKIVEESGEVAEAVASGKAEHVEDEIGDLFFVMVNLARHAGVDPETALRGANAKFERRFAHVEDGLAARGKSPREASLAEMDALWDECKRLERQGEK